MKIDVPYLSAWFDCWLFQIRINVNLTNSENDCKEYIALEFSWRHSPILKFKLFDSAYRIFERKHGKTMDQARAEKIARMTSIK